jgi:hypothetical protein
MSFAALSLRRDRMVGHVVLARRLEHPRLTKIELSPLVITSILSRSIPIHSWITKFSHGFEKLTASASNFTYRRERITARRN